MAEPDAADTAVLHPVFEERARMVGLARRLLAEAKVPESVVDAEDAVQDAFAKTLRHPAAVRDPRAYVYRIVRREVAAHAARYARRGRAEAVAAADEQMERRNEVADFSELLVQREALYEALGGLPAQQRRAAWATHAMGMTQSQAASAMGMAPGTVSCHVSRALKALRLALITVVMSVVAALPALLGSAPAAPLCYCGRPDGKHPELPLDDLFDRWPDIPLPWLSGLLLIVYALRWVVATSRKRPTRRPRTVHRAWERAVNGTDLWGALAREGIYAHAWIAGTVDFPGGTVVLTGAWTDCRGGELGSRYLHSRSETCHGVPPGRTCGQFCASSATRHGGRTQAAIVGRLTVLGCARYLPCCC